MRSALSVIMCADLSIIASITGFKVSAVTRGMCMDRTSPSRCRIESTGALFASETAIHGRSPGGRSLVAELAADVRFVDFNDAG